MSTNRDMERMVRSWLQEEQHESANRVLDAVLDLVDTTPQSSATWWARRLPKLNDGRLRIGIAAAVLILVAAVGSQFLAASRTGGPPATPAPTPTPARLPVNGTLEPGSYLMSAEWGGVPFSFTVPRGWTIDRDGFISKNTSGTVTESTTGVLLAAFKVDHVYADACRHGTLEPIGSSVESLATALANQAGRETSGPVGVFVDGYPGQRVELTAPMDLSNCDGFLHTWSDVGGNQTGGWPAGPGQTDDVYILDVSGTRLVIVATRWPDTTPQDVVELNRVVASIRIK